MIDVVKAVVDKLDSYFGKDINYIEDDFEQGVEKPCFLISLINDDLDTELSGSGWYTAMVNVVYMSDTDSREDKLSKRMALYSLLENITVGDVGVYAYDLNCNSSVDEDVNFIASYKVRTSYREEEKQPNMESIEVIGGLKNEGKS